MDAGAAAVARALAAGRQHQGAEQFVQAVACFRAARQALAALPEDGRAGRALQAAQLAVAEAEALVDLGELAAAQAVVDPLVDAWPHAPGDGDPEERSVLALLLLESARSLVGRRQVAPVCQHVDDALRCLDGLPDCQLLRARAWGLKGTALCLNREFDAGLELLRAAAAVLAQPQHGQALLQHALLQVNAANALGEQGDFDAAARVAEGVEPVFQGCAEAGSIRGQVELARLRMNLGSLREMRGQAAAALPLMRAAIAGFDDALRRAEGRADAMRPRMLGATARMNLGYALFRAGHDEEAEIVMRRACRLYAVLVKTHPEQHRQPQARAYTNLAHLMARQQRWAPAARLYKQALDIVDGLAAEGKGQVLPDQANVSLGLARVEMARGRLRPASQWHARASATLVELARRGQLHYGPSWLEGWQAQLSGLLDRSQKAPAASLVAALQTLRDLVHQAPEHGGLGAGDPVPQRLLQAATAARGWMTRLASLKPRPAAALTAVIEAYVSYLLSCMADVLADSEPQRLQRHDKTLQAAAAELYAVAAAMPQAPVLLADWFLHTRGLRAQRSALTQGHDGRLAELRQQLQALRELEDDLLGATRRPAATAAAGAVPVPAASTPLSRAEQWQRLRTRTRELREAAVADGLLPAAPRLQAAALLAQLPADRAVLMLAREPGGGLLVLALRGGAAGRGTAEQVVARLQPAQTAFTALELNRLARAALVQQAAGRGLRMAAPVDLADELHHDAAPAVAAVAQTSPQARQSVDDADRFALDVMRPLWSEAVTPVVRRLQQAGVSEISLVPSGDLHLVPWSHYAVEDASAPVLLQVYPSAGAWARCRLLQGAARADALAARGARWAAAVAPALDGPHPLPWAVLEARLAARLSRDLGGSWHELSGSPPAAQGVTAFVGIGHGATPGDNPAHAGLGWAGETVLTGHDLKRVDTCHGALLSACVLGCTDEIHGEALGFLSSCFDYRTSFGTGWLTEVPDAEACLASLALQHALRHAPGAASALQVVTAARQAMQAGAWPEGFGPWLALHLPGELGALDPRWHRELRLARDPTLADAPPPALQRLLPWLVVLGR